MTSTPAAMSGVAFALQAPGSTTGNGNVLAIPPSFRNHNILIKGSAGIGAGAIQIETSNDIADANTWAPIGGPVTVIASTDIVVNLTGYFKFLRARISTNLTGGTVGVDYESSSF